MKRFVRSAAEHPSATASHRIVSRVFLFSPMKDFLVACLQGLYCSYKKYVNPTDHALHPSKLGHRIRILLFTLLEVRRYGRAIGIMELVFHLLMTHNLFCFERFCIVKVHQRQDAVCCSHCVLPRPFASSHGTGRRRFCLHMLFLGFDASTQLLVAALVSRCTFLRNNAECNISVKSQGIPKPALPQDSRVVSSIVKTFVVLSFVLELAYKG